MTYGVVFGCGIARSCWVDRVCAAMRPLFRLLARRIGVGAVSLVVLTACDGQPGGLGSSLMIPQARPGIATSFQDLMVEVPGAKVNASGGNLYVKRDDLNVDTRLGNWGVGAVWNSATGEWRWNFDMTMKPTPRGHALRFIDESGHTMLVGRTALGYPIGGTHWTKHASDAMRTHGGLIYQFDEAGELASVYWGSDDYPRLEFVRNGAQLQTIDQCRGAGDCHTLFTMTYDGFDRLASVVDLAGRTSLYTYVLGSGRIASARDPLDVANGWPGTRYEYDPEGRLVADTNSHEERVEYQYYGVTKSIMKVVHIGDGDPLWAFAYAGLDGDGLATTTVVDPVGAATDYRFDLYLRLFRKTNGNNESWKWRYDGYSYARISETSPAGVVRLFDGLSLDVATETRPNGNVVTTTYAPWPAENRADPKSRAVLSIVDGLGAVETRAYSASGVLESVANGAGETTTYTTTPAGDRVVTDAAGVVTTYGNRGDHGHYLTATQGTKTVNSTYDLVGNWLSADGLLDEPRDLSSDSIGQGGIVARFYDADRNVSALVLDDGGPGAQGVLSSLNVTWRADHQRSLIARPYGGDTEFLYDARGRKREARTKVDGVWKSTLFERDARGDLTAILKPNGMATRYGYRAAGEVVSISHERDWGDPFEVESHVDLIYVDARLTEIRDSAHAMAPELLNYDADGLLDRVVYPNGESQIYAYDLRERPDVQQFVRPDLSVLKTFDYAYDLAGRVISVDEDALPVADVSYADGRNVGALYGNGVVVANSFDPVTGAFTGFTATNAAQQLVASMTVSSTTCGLSLPASPCKVEQTNSLLGVSSSSYSEYQVEDQGSERLIADSHGILAPTDRFYTYDELSNVQESAAGIYIYNAERNRLLRIEAQGIPVVEYVYDDAGYVVSRNGVAINWNGMGRVVSAGTDLAMQWDALGRRVSLVVSGDEMRWKYGESVVEDAFASNQTIDLGWMVTRLDAATHEYRIHDFRGNVKLCLDDAGQVSAHHTYSGYAREATAGIDESSVGFARGIHAADFVILGQRVYDPISRRFISEDPIFQVVNQFSYTLGNPVRYWDPGGDFPIPAVKVTGGFKGPVPHLSVEISTPAGEGDAGSGGGEGANSGGSGDGGAEAGSEGGAVGEGQGGVTIHFTNNNSNSFVSCGLGFEIVPLLLAWFAIRQRRRARGRG